MHARTHTRVLTHTHTQKEKKAKNDALYKLSPYIAAVKQSQGYLRTIRHGEPVLANLRRAAGGAVPCPKIMVWATKVPPGPMRCGQQFDICFPISYQNIPLRIVTPTWQILTKVN